MRELTPEDLSSAAFPFGASRDIELGYARVRATRMSYVGDLGWELYIPSEFALGVYDVIAEAGGSHGLVMAGYHALNSLRIEKAFRHWGHDISDEDTPLEAGLGFAVDFGKPGGFLGEAALLKQREQPLTRRLIQFLVNDPEPLLYHDEPIWRDDVRVGRTTSGMYGHSLVVQLGLATLSIRMALMMSSSPRVAIPSRSQGDVIRQPPALAHCMIRLLNEPAGKVNRNGNDR
ncbi:MAG: hypothetical protein CM1200mP41_25180 [Gammaproteobacteria bacterium]|nr:MAG: hypothetical protein CM1200mP41_25180 [Gammaproteobacteria bacterium]